MLCDKAPTTCAHQVVLGLCVASCLAFATWPRPVQNLRSIEASMMAHEIATHVLGLGTVPSLAWNQFGTEVSIRGSWPRRIELSPKNPL